MEFERLIEAERRNDELLRRAREEAVAIRRAARERVAEREAALTADLEAARRAHDDAIALRRAATLDEITEGARQEAARYAAVSDAEITAVTGRLLDLVIAEGRAS